MAAIGRGRREIEGGWAGQLVKVRRVPVPDQLIAGHSDPARGQWEEAQPDEAGARTAAAPPSP
ncbi:MAG: hypothetical protein WBU92_08480, partial [Candidatus Dormiibacterota bacterium]